MATNARKFFFCLSLLLYQLPGIDAVAASKNGFVLDGASIPVREIRSGGPPRDGIPSLDQPRFVPLDEANFMHPKDRVLGVVIDREARAYPIKILNHHELVNDRIGNQNFVVSYCPLCGTGMVFATNSGKNTTLVFGVSGLLYNSDVLLYDRNTESLWSQMMSVAISGPYKGTKLPLLPSLHTSFEDWKTKYPDSTILSTQTGYRRNYEENPYEEYERTRKLWFRVSHKAPRTYHPKEQVLGVEIDGATKAYPFIELSKGGRTTYIDWVAQQKVIIHWDEESRSASIENAQGEVISSTIAYWFAWFTFHPDTEVFKPDSGG